jgi:hypothetical protein
MMLLVCISVTCYNIPMRMGLETKRTGRGSRSSSDDRDLWNGLSLKRWADYDDTTELSTDLQRLKKRYPSMTARGNGGSSKDIMLQVIRSSVIKNNRQRLGHLTVGEALDGLRSDVPALTKTQEVTATWVDTQTDPHTGATYIVIVPGALEVLRLCRERYQGYHSIARTAGSRQKLTFPQPTPDLTVAYVPQSEGVSAVEDAVIVAEAHLPLTVRLLPAL